MQRIENHLDEMRGTITYDLGDGKRITFDSRAVARFGLARLMRAHNIEMQTGRIPVIHHGRRVGTMPPDFDPASTRSMSLMYDARPGDFRREGDTWIASRSLGPGDLDCVAGFVRESPLTDNPPSDPSTSPAAARGQ